MTRLLAGLAMILLAWGVVRAAQPEQDYRETLYVFGTLVEITVQGSDGAATRAAVAEAGQLLQQLHRDWHAWRPGQLTQLNAAFAQEKSLKIDKSTAALLQRGQLLSCLSGGRFEPAIGQMIALWGFHADTAPTGAPPSPDEISALTQLNPRMSDLRFDGLRVSSSNPAVQLDLGGYAKGAALDLVGALLQRHGITNAVLNAGGDVNVLGHHRDRPWRVAIRDPFVWGAVGAVELQPGEVLYTSGNYERYFDHDGQRFAHILDPRTGMPVQDIVSVSVLHRDGALADAAATALSVAGPKDWPQVAADMGVAAVLMITGDGRILGTDDMLNRLQPVGAGFPTVPVAVALPEAKAHCQP